MSFAAPDPFDCVPRFPGDEPKGKLGNSWWGYGGSTDSRKPAPADKEEQEAGKGGLEGYAYLVEFDKKVLDLLLGPKSFPKKVGILGVDLKERWNGRRKWELVIELLRICEFIYIWISVFTVWTTGCAGCPSRTRQHCSHNGVGVSLFLHKGMFMSFFIVVQAWL